MKKVTLHGTTLATEDRGSGRPLVLVHGFPLDHTMWEAQIEALSGRWRVIAPDLRGFGQSGVSAGTVTMEQFADDVAGLLEALEIREPVVLCGLSMGGYVAWQFWRKYAARLRGLILCDTRADADSTETAAARRETAGRVLCEGPGVLAEAMLPRLLAPETLQARPEIAGRLRRTILGCDPRGAAAAALGMAQRPDVTSQLALVGCPTLVIVGALDVISPVEEMLSIAGKIPAARFVSIDGAGHMAPMERPAEVNDAIAAFLNEVA
jgi:pimeloyl-ACP methyl ester carboxylesterase